LLYVNLLIFSIILSKKGDLEILNFATAKCLFQWFLLYQGRRALFHRKSAW